MTTPTWKQFTFSCGAKDADVIGDELTELGAISVTLENADQSILFEPTPGSRPVWEHVLLKALFDDALPQNEDTLANQLQKKYPNSQLKLTSIDTINDQDWQSAWKQDYKPVKVTKKLWICPSWKKAPDPQAINILLDPGLAFGTGTHPTTFMCLEWLEKNIQRGETLIDYGCGSGILAIAALKLGCKKAIAVDIDSQALTVTQENAEKNQIATTQLNCYLPEETPQIKTDIIIANILANPLIDLANTLTQLAKPGTKIALSGLLLKQAEKVKMAYQPAFQFSTDLIQHDWVLLQGELILHK